MNNGKLRVVAFLNCMGFNTVETATITEHNGNECYKVRFRDGDIYICQSARNVWKAVHSIEREYYHRLDYMTGTYGPRNPFFFNNRRCENV